MADSSEPAKGGPARKPFVLVTMGMDHHPFQRLVDWVDRWLAAGAAQRVECLIQCGPARSTHVDSVDFLEYPELESAMARAAVIVCHAGPGSIMMARWVGHRPVVVPRLAELGEVVDNHQVTFARQLAGQGEVLLAETEERFREAAETSLAEPRPPRTDLRSLEMTEPLRRFDRLIRELVPHPRGGRK